MPQVVVGDRVLVTFRGILNAQRIMTTFLYRCSAAVTPNVQNSVLIDLVAQMSLTGGVWTRFMNFMPTNYICDEVWAQVISPARFRKTVVTKDQAGFNDVATGTSNIQGSITRVGEMARRFDVGGIRLPIGTSDEVMLDGLLTATQKTMMELICDAMRLTIITPAPACTFIPQVGVPKGTEADPRDPSMSVDLSDAFVQPEVRVMPRRTVGRGI